MEEKLIKYPHPNGEITVLWRPERCIHSSICVKTLPQVYNPKARPWVTPEYATTEELIDQIDHCPSKALQYELHKTD
ncbi:(4Fe-4S)-binding protein [Sphingobacterium lactis]|uniref:(4Fe-4S)-binding protein n=1 Tax=Sphingobacterium lactis TaxID=797291 RepID=UPI003DA4D27E